MVRALKVQFMIMCEKVNYRTSVLTARTAFVTFDSEEVLKKKIMSTLIQNAMGIGD